MATRYWVGGSGNWDSTSTANWSASSGGASGASAPTSADDVIFDANSNVGTGAFTVTAVGGVIASCANFTASGLDGAMTLSLSATSYIDCFGSLTLPASNFTWTGVAGCYIRFRGTGSYTITTNGVTITGTQIATLAAGTWTLGSALTTTLTLDLQQGSFNTSNFNVSTQQLLFQLAATRTFNAGSSTITCTSAIPFTYIGSNLTFNAGTSQITCSAAGTTFTGGGLTFYNVSFTSTALGVVTITGANTFNNLTFAARAASGFGTVLFSTGVTNTVNGTLTLGSGTTGIARLQVRSATFSLQTTLSVATLAAMTDIDFRDVVAAGAASPFSGTRIGDCGNNTNITFTTARTVYWNSAASANWNGAVWSTTSGNTGGTTTAFPLAQDTVIIDNAGLTTGNTITVNANWQMPTLNFSSRSNAATFATGAQVLSLFGDYILSSAITVTGTGLLTFLKYGGTATITSAAKTFPQPVQCYVTGGTLRINGDLTLGSTLTFTLAQGTLDLTNNGAGNYKLTTGVFTSNSNINVRTLAFGTGTIELTGNNATIWNCTSVTNFTITGTPTVNCTYSGSTGTRTITNPPFSNVGIVNFNVSAGSDNIVMGSGTNINYTGFTGTQTSIAASIYGNLTYGTGMTTVTGTGTFQLAATSGTQQITTNSVVINYSITISGVGGTVQLQDNLTLSSANTLILTSGTFDANDNNVSIGLFNSNNSNTRTLLMGSGTWTLTGTGNVWNIVTSTGITLTPSTSTIVFNGSGIGTFTSGSLTYYNLTQSSSNALTIRGANTFNTISNTVQPTTITFQQNLTHTVTNFNVNGTAGNLVTINTVVSGAQATLSKASGTVNVSYVSLKDNNATGGAIWQAPSNQGNTIVSNVTGWFTSALYADAVTEDSQPADVSTTQTNFNSDITEDSQPADIQTVQANFNSAITENSNPADSSVVVKLLNPSITEAITSTDSLSVQAIFKPAIIESMNNVDIASVQAKFNSFVNENMVLFDQSIGYGWFRVVDSQTVTWTSVNDTQSITWTNVNDAQSPNWVQINNEQP
jgi:hypothetical protein